MGRLPSLLHGYGMQSLHERLLNALNVDPSLLAGKEEVCSIYRRNKSNRVEKVHIVRVYGFEMMF